MLWTRLLTALVQQAFVGASADSIRNLLADLLTSVWEHTGRLMETLCLAGLLLKQAAGVSKLDVTQRVTPVQDLSRPSATSSASLARMIGGLALAGTTATITDHPNSPRAPPASASGRPRGVAFGVQSGPLAAGADGQEPLHMEADGENGTSMNPEGQDSTLACAGAANDGDAVKASEYGYVGTGRNLNEGDAGQQGTGHASQNVSAATLAGSLPSLSQGDTKNSTAAAAATTAARPGSNVTPTSTAFASGSDHMHSDSIYGDSIHGISGTPSDGARPTWAGGMVGTAGDPTGPSSIAAYRPGRHASVFGAGGHGTEAQPGFEAASQDPGQSSGRGLGGLGVGVGPSSGVGPPGGPENRRATTSDLSAGPSQVQLICCLSKDKQLEEKCMSWQLCASSCWLICQCLSNC